MGKVHHLQILGAGHGRERMRIPSSDGAIRPSPSASKRVKASFIEATWSSLRSLPISSGSSSLDEDYVLDILSVGRKWKPRIQRKDRSLIVLKLLVLIFRHFKIVGIFKRLGGASDFSSSISSWQNLRIWCEEILDGRTKPLTAWRIASGF